MKKILLSCVGKRDPIAKDNTGNVTEGAIITAYKYIKPDWVYLFPTMRKPNIVDNTEEEAIKTRVHLLSLAKELNNNLEISIMPLNVNDPTDYKEVLIDIRRKIQQIKDDTEGLIVEFFISLSSGTPQMQASWLLFINSGFIRGKVYQAIAPEYVKGGNKIKEIDVTFLEEESIVKRIQHLINDGIFSVATVELNKLANEITWSLPRREITLILVDVLESYNQWDMIKYDIAKQKIEKVINNYHRYPELNDLLAVLKQQLQVLNELNDISQAVTINPSNYPTDKIYLILIDLYYNMTRRYEEGNYVDTLARFWRIYEESLFYMLRKKGIDPQNIKLSTNKSNLNLISGYLGKTYNNLSIKKSELAISILYSNFKKDLKKIIINVEGKESKNLLAYLKNLRELRNTSITAHGLSPVNQKDAELAIEVSKNLLSYIFNSRISDFDKHLNNYVFRKEAYYSVIVNVLNIM